MDTKSIAAHQITVGCHMPNKNDIRLTNKAGFDTTGMLFLGTLWAYHYFPKFTAYAVLFMEMFPTK
jgi:hypothetical protein